MSEAIAYRPHQRPCCVRGHDGDFPDGIEKGSTIIFVGPEYLPDVDGGPTIGERGVVVERAGYHSQRIGEKREEMITCRFPLDKRDTVIPINSVKLA